MSNQYDSELLNPKRMAKYRSESIYRLVFTIAGLLTIGGFYLNAPSLPLLIGAILLSAFFIGDVINIIYISIMIKKRK